MFKKVDCIRLHINDLSTALSFYQGKLGLDLVWKKGNSEAGLKMLDSDTELVLVREDLEHPELDLTVESVEESVNIFKEAGGNIIVEPFEIAIGKCSVIEDPWGNKLVILDNSKGRLKVDENKNVI